MLTTIAFVPYEYDNYVFLANLYNIAGQILDPAYYEKAVAIADRGIAVEPFGPAIRVQRAHALVGLNRLDDALKDASSAVSMDPTYTEATQLLADIYIRQGRKDLALKALSAFPQGWPGTPTIAAEIKSLEASGSAASSTAP